MVLTKGADGCVVYFSFLLFWLNAAQLYEHYRNMLQESLVSLICTPFPN